MLCGAGRDAAEYPTAEALRKAYGVRRDACVWQHALLPPWPCDHVRCSMQAEDKGCPACAAAAAARQEDARVEADRERVLALLDGGGLSDSIGALLRAWASDPDVLVKLHDCARVMPHSCGWRRTTASGAPATGEPGATASFNILYG